jgi:hypothetical protein
VLVGSAAQPEAVLNRLPTCWLAHLACHGVSKILERQAIRLLLSDGDVTLEQVLQLPSLRARLVVLSACQDGQVNLVQVSDEMLGLPLAFLQAGACAVVGMLWPIDDRVTAMLIRRIYEELAAEISMDGRGDVAAALVRAQRWLRSLTRAEARRWRQERGVQELPTPQRSVSATPPSLPDSDAPYADPYFWAGIVAYRRRRGYTLAYESVMIGCLVGIRTHLRRRGHLVSSMCFLPSAPMRSAGMNAARKCASNSSAVPPAPHMQKRATPPSKCTSPSAALPSSGAKTSKRWSSIASSPTSSSMKPHTHCAPVMSLPFTEGFNQVESGRRGREIRSRGALRSPGRASFQRFGSPSRLVGTACRSARG